MKLPPLLQVSYQVFWIQPFYYITFPGETVRAKPQFYRNHQKNRFFDRIKCNDDCNAVSAFFAAGTDAAFCSAFFVKYLRFALIWYIIYLQTSGTLSLTANRPLQTLNMNQKRGIHNAEDNT